MPTFTPDSLRTYGARIFEACGAPEKHAKLVADMLVDSNLAGHPSHGVIRIVQYVNSINAGTLDPKVEPLIEKENFVYAGVSGQRGFGQVAAVKATRLAIDKAKNAGLALVGCYNTNHIGRLGDYVMTAARAGFVGVGFCNGGGPNVAPFGSRERVLGTNPVALSAPIADGKAIEIDFASAATAEGKLRVARNKGVDAPAGLMLDKEGEPTVDPKAFYDGGAILPIGQHKGSGLSLMLEILGGVLTGGRCSAFDGYQDGNGALFLFIKPDLFRSREGFDTDLNLIWDAVKGSQTAADCQEVLFPGEPEQQARQDHGKAGIELDDTSWKLITDIGTGAGVSFE